MSNDAFSTPRPLIVDDLRGNIGRPKSADVVDAPKLLSTSAHAFRKVFGTRDVARDILIDVVQHPRFA